MKVPETPLPLMLQQNLTKTIFLVSYNDLIEQLSDPDMSKVIRRSLTTLPDGRISFSLVMEYDYVERYISCRLIKDDLGHNVSMSLNFHATEDKCSDEPKSCMLFQTSVLPPVGSEDMKFMLRCMAITNHMKKDWRSIKESVLVSALNIITGWEPSTVYPHDNIINTSFDEITGVPIEL